MKTFAWSLVGLYAALWLFNAGGVVIWCLAAVDVGSMPAAGLGGMAVAGLVIFNPYRMAKEVCDDLHT